MTAKNPADAIYVVYLLAMEDEEQKTLLNAVMAQAGIDSLYSLVEWSNDDLLYDLSYFGNNPDKVGMLLTIASNLYYFLQHPEDKVIWSYFDEYSEPGAARCLWDALRYVSRSLIASAEKYTPAEIAERLAHYLTQLKNEKS